MVTICLEIIAYPGTVALTRWTYTNTNTANLTATTSGAARATVEDVVLEIHTLARTSRLSRGAIINATPTHTHLPGHTGVGTSPAVVGVVSQVVADP